MGERNQAFQLSFDTCLKADFEASRVTSNDGLLGLRRAVVRFWNNTGTAEQRIEEGMQVAHWTRLSYDQLRANGVRLQWSVLAYNLGKLWRGWLGWSDGTTAPLNRASSPGLLWRKMFLEDSGTRYILRVVQIWNSG